jgi:hypothetical protein
VDRAPPVKKAKKKLRRLTSSGPPPIGNKKKMIVVGPVGPDQSGNHSITRDWNLVARLTMPDRIHHESPASRDLLVARPIIHRSRCLVPELPRAAAMPSRHESCYARGHNNCTKLEEEADATCLSGQAMWRTGDPCSSTLSCADEPHAAPALSTIRLTVLVKVYLVPLSFG